MINFVTQLSATSPLKLATQRKPPTLPYKHNFGETFQKSIENNRYNRNNNALSFSKDKNAQAAQYATDTQGSTSQSNKSIDTYMNQMKGSPTGAKLVEQLQAKGTKVQFDSSLPEGVNGATDPDNNVIYINPKNDDAKIIETLAHESGHAITPEGQLSTDGQTDTRNSKEEEANNKVLGSQVAEELGMTNQAMTKQEAMTEVKKTEAYAKLPDTNGHAQQLAQKGINLTA